MEIQELKQKLNAQKNKIGLVGGSIKISEYDESEHNVSAQISPQGWNIEVSLRKGFNPIQDKRQQAFARKKKIEDGLEVLLSGVTYHEFGHWELPHGSEKGCPYDVYNHDKILEAVKQALPQDKQSQAGYVTNAFEDVLVNARGKEFQGNLDGLTMFWDNEGLTLKEKGGKNFTPFYEVFVKMNQYLSGDNTENSLLKRHYSKNKKIEKGIKAIAKEWNLDTDKSGFPVNLKETAALFDKSRWPGMAASFARNFADLLEDSPTERLSAYSPEQGEGREGQPEQKKQQAGNGIEQKMATREGKEEVAYGRYSSEEGLSSNFTSYEQLDALYRRLAKPLIVKVDAMTHQHGLNISPLTFRPFDEEKDSPNNIKLSKLYLTDQGLRFGYPNQPLTINAKSKTQKRSFPDFKMVVLDNSGSMQEGIDGSGKGKTDSIPWGDNSKYHYALLGFYGIENFLQQQGVAQYIQHGLSMFSSNTRFKEAGFMDIDSVRKMALNPEFGNTYIDAKTLEQALSGRESFVISLSDGEVGNWDSEKNTFIGLAKNNHYAHIQLGDKTKFSQDLEAEGFPVFYVSSGNDLGKLMVDITKRTYDNYIKQ